MIRNSAPPSTFVQIETPNGLVGTAQFIYQHHATNRITARTVGNQHHRAESVFGKHCDEVCVAVL